MSTGSASRPAGSVERARGAPALARVRWYFASDSMRAIQTVLGLLWLLDGGLQFQPFMYGEGFIQMLTGMAAGQPGWLHDSVIWGARFLQQDPSVWNTLFALTQVLIGLALLVRPTVKVALAASFGWVLVVWWFGEAFGMLFMTMASPLAGAPGSVLLYAVIGAIVWPGPRPGGLLSVRGARTAWAALWLVLAWLWLGAPSSSANAITGTIDDAMSGMSWLSAVQDWVARGAEGNGLPIALVLALASVAIAIAVAANWRPRPFLALAIVLNLAYWVLGQGLGGIFHGEATDPNTGPLFVLLAIALYSLIGVQEPDPASFSIRGASRGAP